MRLAGAGNGPGTIYKITYKITPAGKLTTLYNLSETGGPIGGLIQASDGDFYGTTGDGGANGYGSVLKITSNGTPTTLYSFWPQFNGYCLDGSYPLRGARPVQLRKHNLVLPG